MVFNIRRLLPTIILAALVSGCSSIKLPDMDFIKFPEFKEEAKNIPDYPDVASAPPKPTGLRSDALWDQAANNILAKRDGFPDPDLIDAKTDAEIIREMQRLRDKADAYKKDDPQ